MTKSIVYIIGAGPGSPDLITVRGMQCLTAADVVLYDRLVNPRLLATHAGNPVVPVYEAATARVDEPNAVAALNCRALGARGGMPTASEVERLLMARSPR